MNGEDRTKYVSISEPSILYDVIYIQKIDDDAVQREPQEFFSDTGQITHLPTAAVIIIPVVGILVPRYQVPGRRVSAQIHSE